MATVITVGNVSNTLYNDICMKLAKSAEMCEHDRIFCVYIYFTILSGLIQKLGCFPNVITLYPEYTRDVDKKDDFNNNLSSDTDKIYHFVKWETFDLNYFLFGITFKLPHSYKSPFNNTHFNLLSDELLFQCSLNKKEDGFYFTYFCGDMKVSFPIKDYNNKDEIGAVIDSMTDLLSAIYGDEKSFTTLYLTYRIL